MSTYKIILDKRRKKQNDVYPLKVRIYDQASTRETSLGISIREQDWNAKEQVIISTDPNYKVNSYKLVQAKAKLDKASLLLEDGDAAETLLKAVNSHADRKQDITLRRYSEGLISSLIMGKKAGTAMAYTDAVNSIISYAGEQVTLKSISYSFLCSYHTRMLAKGVKVNSIAAYLRGIRAIYNKGIKEGLVNIGSYPFARFKIETEDTFNRTLTIEQMKLFLAQPLKPETAVWHNRNFFLLSFCLVGINFADLFTLEADNIKSGIVHYQRAKTGKLYSITMHPTVIELFHYYRQKESLNDGKYLLPSLRQTEDVMEQKKLIKQLCKTCNKYLKKIAEDCKIDIKVTTYYARYSWANIAKKLGYTKDFIAEALGHEYGNAVTGIYLDRYETEKIDEANRKVIAAVM